MITDSRKKYVPPEKQYDKEERIKKVNEALAEAIENGNHEALVDVVQYYRPFIVSKVDKYHTIYNLPISKDEFIHDMEQKLIEYALDDFHLEGTSGYKACFTIFITHKLDRACLNYAKKMASMARRFIDVQSIPGSDSESMSDAEIFDSAMQKSLYTINTDSITATMNNMQHAYVKDIVDYVVEVLDDRSIISEVEATTFKLANPFFTNPSVSHITIAKMTGKSRPRISQLYNRAKSKLRSAIMEKFDLDINDILI